MASSVEFIRDESKDKDEVERASESSVEDMELHKTERQAIETVKIIFLQMEHCDSEPLNSYVEAKPAIPAEERWKLFRQILEALAYSHGKDVVHGDLRPENIYLTKDKKIKLANFAVGLSPARNKDQSPQPETPTSLTESRATRSQKFRMAELRKSMYRSPEVERGESLSDKADIYSLGVVLFEMCYPLYTHARREVVLATLRKRVEFPADFDSVVEGAKEVKELVGQCLAFDPADRPTSLSLLESDLLPRRIEDEAMNKFIRTIKNPKTMESQKLMSILFLKGNSPEIEFTDDDPTLHTRGNKGTTDFYEEAEEYRLLLVSKLSQIFQRHSATAIEANLFYPHSQCKTIFVCSRGKSGIKQVDLRKITTPLPPTSDVGLDQATEETGAPSTKVVKYIYDIPQHDEYVKLMDPQRLLLQVAYNLHIPWSRAFSRATLAPKRPIKRYAFGNAYAHGEHTMKPHPHCCFDITTERCLPYDSRLEVMHEAEVLKVVDEVFGELYGKDKYRLRLNSTLILDCVLKECGVHSAMRPKLYQWIRKEMRIVHGKRVPMPEAVVNEAAERVGFGSPKKLLDFLNLRAETPEDLEAKMNSIFQGFNKNAAWTYAIGQLKKLYSYCEGLRINMNRMMLDTSLMPDNNLVYHAGLFFAVLAEHRSRSRTPGPDDTVAAIGGRFDNTLSQYMSAGQSAFGVGVEISCEAIAEEFAGIVPKPDHDSVLVAFGGVLSGGVSEEVKIGDCIKVMGELWKKGLESQADFFSLKTEGQWSRYCEENRLKRFAMVEYGEKTEEMVDCGWEEKVKVVRTKLKLSFYTAGNLKDVKVHVAKDVDELQKLIVECMI